MKAIQCAKCGKRTTYTERIPKACKQCGTKFRKILRLPSSKEIDAFLSDVRKFCWIDDKPYQ